LEHSIIKEESIDESDMS
jgi:hypothetical protein